MFFKGIPFKTLMLPKPLPLKDSCGVIKEYSVIYYSFRLKRNLESPKDIDFLLEIVNEMRDNIDQVSFVLCKGSDKKFLYDGNMYKHGQVSFGLYKGLSEKNLLAFIH